MAKGKAQELTIEEKLAQVLVPEDEQPYEVPSNWVWTKIKNLAFVTKLAGFEYTKYIAPNLSDSGIPLFKGKNVQSGELIHIFESYIPKEISDLLPRSKVNKKCLLTPYVGTIGNVALFDGNSECHLGSNVGKIEISSCMLEEFMLYFLRSSYGYKELTKHKKATAQESISINAIRDVCIPLPPIAEQQRIVDRIESLFAKFDQAKELAQNALDTFETRKAAILHKAFTGELTTKWREINGVQMDSWEECYWSKVADMVKDRYDPSCENSDLPYIGLEHIEKGNGIVSVGKAEEVKSLKTLFKAGDILYGKLRPYLNKHDIAEFDGMCSTDILAFRTRNLETAKYLNYYLDTTPFINYAVSNSKGINLPRISEKEIGTFILNIPSFSEQQEIVSILDELFEKEQKAKELCDVIEKIDLMKKAILARAFRGELGTNDPADQNAIQLLKECLR